MDWEIICYNGYVWKVKSQMLLSEALNQFIRDTGLSEFDIKTVRNNR